MSKIRLALIGKNIQGSQSPNVYKKLLDQAFEYSLIDCNDERDLPSLADLRSQYNGVSITSPYKKKYLRNVEVVGEYNQSINALSFNNQNQVTGINTDYLAVRELLQKRYNTFSDIVIIGDGSMSEVLQKVCTEAGRFYQVLSRKQKNLSLINEVKQGALIVNTCSKEYVFKTQSPRLIGKFWSLNYGNLAEQEYLMSQAIPYENGMELLTLQAKYALSFWGLIDNSVL